MNEPHDLSTFQIVRQDFVSEPEEPQLTFNNGRIYINSYGLSLFPEENYIRLLVDDKAHGIAVIPFKKRQKDSFRWCGSREKRRPRHMRAMPLYYLVYKMMSWDINARYHITGQLEDHGERRILYFNLRDAVCFQRTDSYDDRGNRIIKQSFPADWLESYGQPVMDYNARHDIKTFDDIGVFDVELEVKNKGVISTGVREHGVEKSHMEEN